MNWTQPKSFVNDNQKTINVMGNKLPKGVTLVKGVEGRGGGGVAMMNNAHVWVRILFLTTVIEFDL